MRSRRLQVTVGLAALAVTLCAASPASAESERVVEAARLRGIEYIKSQQGPDGGWFFNGHVVGITSLCGLALVENGLPVSDSVVEKAHSFVRKSCGDVQNTYDLALAILFLSRIGDRDNRNLIREMAAKLIAGQNKEGGWSYTCPKVTASVLSRRADLPDKADGPGDNSCTQFAVIGLWVASRWGVNIDDTMKAVDERFVTTAMEDGGWAYNHTQDGAASRDSMTFAGLFCLTVAKATRIRQEQEDARRNTTSPRTERGPETKSATLLDDPVYAQGLERAGKFAGGIGQNSARYFIWSVERLGVLLELDKFGETDWFENGSTALVKSQKDDGSWAHSNADWGSLADTSFAILFLRKANLGSDISRLLRGEPAERFQNMSRPDKPTFQTLVQAVKGAEAGDLIRINGNGPFDLPHLTIDKDLSIEAGPGYTPSFRYTAGYDETGRAHRPESDPDVRFLLRVNAGTLTLEGLDLQMDPPDIPAASSFAGILLNGGNARLLNCMISESSRKDLGMAGLVVAQPAEVVLRNCLLVGGRAAVEVLTTGEQKLRFENSVLFSKNGFSVFNGPPGDAPDLTLDLQRSVVQSREVFNFPKLSNPVHITSMGCAYKADWIGSDMLRSASGHDGLTWKGQDNLYEVTRWIGSAGTAIPRVKDEKTWNSFWGDTDPNGTKRSIIFLGKLRNDAFTHSVRGEDFEFDPSSAVHSFRRRTGIDPLIVGPGQGYTRYRESFEFRAWEKGVEEVAAN
jgi:hypothetical protein